MPALTATVRYALTEHDVLALRPCQDYTRGRVRELWAGRESLTATDIAALAIPAPDRLWCLLRMAPREVWLPAIYACAERAIRHAATALHLAGLHAQSERLCALEPIHNAQTAGEAAWAAAGDAAWAAGAAWAAAWAAAGDAAWAARGAWAAAWAAAGDAAWDAAWAAAGAAAWAAAGAARAAGAAGDAGDAGDADFEITVREVASSLGRPPVDHRSLACRRRVPSRREQQRVARGAADRGVVRS